MTKTKEKLRSKESEDKRAKALRENLMKRKKQQRAKEDTSKTPKIKDNE